MHTCYLWPLRSVFSKLDRTVFRIERYICKTLEFFTDFLWKTWKTWNLTSRKFATEQKSTGKKAKSSLENLENLEFHWKIKVAALFRYLKLIIFAFRIVFDTSFNNFFPKKISRPLPSEKTGPKTRKNWKNGYFLA